MSAPNTRIKSQLSSPILDAAGQSILAPPDGSLGLLALGYVGLMAWRGARRAAVEQQLPVYQSTVHPPTPTS